MLHRLKKAELERLWSVAGLWPERDDEDEESVRDSVRDSQGNHSSADGEDFTKDELIEGIIQSRPPSSSTSRASFESTSSQAASYTGGHRRIARLPTHHRSSSSLTVQSQCDQQASSTKTNVGRSKQHDEYFPHSPFLRRRRTGSLGSSGVSSTADADRAGLQDMSTPRPPRKGGERKRRNNYAVADKSTEQRLSTIVGRRRRSSATDKKQDVSALWPMTRLRRSSASSNSSWQTNESHVGVTEEDEENYAAGDDTDSRSRSSHVRQRGKHTVSEEARRRRGSKTNRGNMSYENEDGDITITSIKPTTQPNAAARPLPPRKAARKAKRAMHNQLDTSDDDDDDLVIQDEAMSDADGTDEEMLIVTSDKIGRRGSEEPPRVANGKPPARGKSSTAQSHTSSALLNARRGQRKTSMSLRNRAPSTSSLEGEDMTSSASETTSVSPDDSEDEDYEDPGSMASTRERKVNGPQQKGDQRSRGRRKSSVYNLRGNDSSGFDLDTRLEGIDLTDDDDRAPSRNASRAEKADESAVQEDVEMDDRSDIANEEEGNEVGQCRDDTSDEFLANATLATLRKLKKAVLIQMCDARELDNEGTKEQLSQWLIEWRDSKSESPTSTASTAKPSSKTTAAETRKKISVPKLLQDHQRVADPHTPPHSQGDTKDDVEADGGLDLEELGLVDKEIPVEQIQKGDKIGSGGFKE